MYIKKDECRRTDAFEPWCWRRLLRVSWTSRRSNQSILKEINPEYSLERLMLNLKLQYFDHLMGKADSKLLKRPWFWERLKVGWKEGGWDGWMASPTRWTWVWVDSGSWWWTERPGVLQFMGSQRVRHDWATELNWIHTEMLPRFWQEVWKHWKFLNSSWRRNGHLKWPELDSTTINMARMCRFGQFETKEDWEINQQSCNDLDESCYGGCPTWLWALSLCWCLKAGTSPEI